MERSFFTAAHLDVCISHASSSSETQDEGDSLRCRTQVYFDEELAFWLHMHLPELDIGHDQAERVFKSPALKLVAELGYLDPARPSSPANARGDNNNPNSHADQQLPILTPTSAVQFDAQDGSFASQRVAHSFWSAQWEDVSPEAFKMWRSEAGWTAAFKWDGVRTSPPKIASSLLAIDITLSFSEALDPTLSDYLERPPTPATPRSNPKRLSKGPAFPTSEYARSINQEVDISSQLVPSALPDDSANPEVEESHQRAARLRRHKMLEEDYAFEGFEEVNLLEDLILDDRHTNEFFVPASRLPTSLATTSLAVGTTAPSHPTGRSKSHTKSLSQAHHRRPSYATGESSLQNDEVPTVRRVHRKVLDACSAVNIRMRTLPISVPSSVSQEPSSQSSPLQGITLSVEVLTSQRTGLGFELSSVSVELDPVHTAKVGNVKSVKQPLFDPVFPILLDRVGQYNFMFSLQSDDVLLNHNDLDALDPQARELPPPTPISAVLSPRETLSRRHQIKLAQQPAPELNQSGISQQTQQFRPQQHQYQAPNDDHRKMACIVVRGRPVSLREELQQDSEKTVDTHYSEIIESRWHTALDLRPLLKTRDQKLHASARSSSISSSTGLAFHTAPQPYASGSRRDPITSTFTEVPLDQGSLTSASPSFSRSQSMRSFVASGDRRSATPLSLSRSASSHMAHPAPQDDEVSLAGTIRGLPLNPQSPSIPKDHSLPPTPAYPPHQQPRPHPIVIAPLEKSRQVFPSSPSNLQFLDSSINRAPNAESSGSGVLVHVSLLHPESQGAEGEEPASTFNPNTPVLPQAEPMRPSLSTTSFKSNVSSRAEAISEEEKGTATSGTAEQRKHSHVHLFDVFKLEVFVMNKTPGVKMFSVGVPSRNVQNEEPASSFRLGPSAQFELPRHNISEGKLDVGVVPLENNVLVGPLQPGTCQSARIKFLALGPGVHSVGELEITDMTTGQQTRLRNVLNLVVDV